MRKLSVYIEMNSGTVFVGTIQGYDFVDEISEKILNNCRGI